jgi:hypothetical protein
MSGFKFNCHNPQFTTVCNLIDPTEKGSSDEASCTTIPVKSLLFDAEMSINAFAAGFTLNDASQPVSLVLESFTCLEPHQQS